MVSWESSEGAVTPAINEKGRPMGAEERVTPTPPGSQEDPAEPQGQEEIS